MVIGGIMGIQKRNIPPKQQKFLIEFHLQLKHKIQLEETSSLEKNYSLRGLIMVQNLIILGQSVCYFIPNKINID